MNLFCKNPGLLKFVKKFTKEIIIALVLAIVAAAMIEFYLDYSKKNMLENNAKAVAKLIVYNAKKEVISTASGVFISPDGKLVTNYHVINNAYSSIDAKLSSGAYYKAKYIIGVSKKHDLAILQFEAKEVPLSKSGKLIK